MERIELFDNYINNQLSDVQRSEFDEKLKNDEDFASDFNVYLMTVYGICREAHQGDMDFGMAMKKLTKEQLREIIGPRHETEREVDAATAYAKPVKPKFIRFKSWMWQAASIAAVVVIAFTAVFKINKSAQEEILRTNKNSLIAVDNAIYECTDIPVVSSRGSGQDLDISSMSEVELKTAIPTLINLYQEAEIADDICDNGYILAMTYIKLHEREKAINILNQLISRFEGDEGYADDVHQWKTILNIIK